MRPQLFMIGALLSHPLWSQSFDGTYGSGTGEFAVGTMTTAAGFRSVATHYDHAGASHEAMVIALTGSGQQTQLLTLSLPGRVFIQATAPAPGSGTYLLGSTIPDGRSDHDALLVRLTATNSVVWTATEDLPGDQQLFGVALLPDGSVIATGVERTTTKHDVLVMRFDLNGGVDWRTTLGGALDEEGNAIAVDGNGALVVGRQMNFGNTSDAYLARLDLDGDLAWETSWGGIKDESFRAVTITPGGYFVAVGFTDSYGDTTYLGHRFRHVWLMGLQADGDTLWTRAIGDTLFDRAGYGLSSIPNGDLYVAGERVDGVDRDGLLMRIDPAATPIWERTMDHGTYDHLGSVITLSNGVLATGWSMGALGHQAWVVRRDGSGD
ncbi:MAG: hypothetical protein KDB97_13760 [Flavobacteriales bacterium]|nr:hypothetical protein [Flavobacteriales bacterium]